MTLTIILALGTSVFFGLGDFLGGYASRKESPFAVTGTSHMFAIVLLGIAALVLPKATFTTADLLWGALSGLTGVVGVVSLFSALSVGRMGVVAPLSAALSASVPALWDLAHGTQLSTITWAGIGLAVAAIVIVSMAPDDQLHEPAHPYQPRKALALAILSGIGFSSAFIALSYVSPESGLAPVLSARVVSIAVTAGMALVTGAHFPVRREALLPTLGAGLTDAVAFVMMLTAIRIGPLAIASVLSSLFPVVVVGLARVFLKERLHLWQKIGVAIAVVAVLLAGVP